jgi:signal peptidase
MKWLKTIKAILYYSLCLFLVVVAATITFSIFKTPWGYRLFVVQSGSMEPAIKTGSVVITSVAKTYQVGDIVAFTTTTIKDVVTHRISSITDDEKGRRFVTKGDANKAVDPQPVPKNNIQGKVRLAIPYAGYFVSFAKTQLGLIMLIIIPGTLIVYSELVSIKNEARRLILEKRQGKLTPVEEVEEEVAEKMVAIEKKIKKKK